jgi:flagellar biosynthesis protein FlhB
MKPADENLWDFIEGKLDPEQKIEWTQRFQNDPELAERVKVLKFIQSKLGSRALQKPSEGFNRRIIDSMGHQESSREKSFFQSLHGIFALIMALIVVLSVVVFATQYSSGGGPNNPDILQVPVPQTLPANSVDLSKLFSSDVLMTTAYCLLAICVLMVIDLFVLQNRRFSSKSSLMSF